MPAEEPRDGEWSETRSDLPTAGAPPLTEEAVSTLPADNLLTAAPIARPVTADADDLVPFLAYARPGFPVMRWWRALLEAAAPLVAAVATTIVAAPLLFVWQPVDERWATVLLSSIGGLTAVLVCLGLLRLGKQPLGSIGWTIRRWPLDAGIGVVAWIGTAVMLLALGVIIGVLYPSIREHQEQVAEAMDQTFPKMSLAVTIVFMAFVATWEEIAFRGFLLTRLRAVFNRWWLAIPVGAVMFGLCHGYEGPMGMAQTTLLGVVMGLLFWWRRSLVPGIVFHTLNNIVAMLMLNLWATQQAAS